MPPHADSGTAAPHDVDAMKTRRKQVANAAVSRFLVFAIGLLSLSENADAQTDEATDYRCVKAADIRLIEVRFTEPDDSLPCKVIYRPEAESDTLGIVSWQDIETTPACLAQALEVVDRLTGEGWTCTVSDRPLEGTVLARTDPVTPSSVDLRRTDGEITDSPVGQLPLAVIPPVDDDAPREEVDEPARFLENPNLAPPTEDLATLIEQDLDRLDTTLDGLLEGMIAGYGDLNEDGLDDALILYTYTSPQPAYRQFLAVYVFDGDTYQLTATRPVSGNVSATMEAEIEAIDRGVVHLTLRAYEPGDASCCPSGTRNLALTLRDLELVEIDGRSPTR